LIFTLIDKIEVDLMMS